MCHQLGRFPYELPIGLPDEQLQLMVAYMEIVAEERNRSQDNQVMSNARREEAELQAAEAEAWKGVLPDG